MRTSDMLVEQSELLLPRDRSSAAHTATPSADSKSSCLDSLGSPLPALTPYGRLAVTWLLTQGRQPSLARASLLRPELHWHSSGTPCLRVIYFTGYLTLCLPARLYTLLLTAINICYRDSCGCFSEYWN
jgi:hypothetical protein